MCYFQMKSCQRFSQNLDSFIDNILSCSYALAHPLKSEVSIYVSMHSVCHISKLNKWDSNLQPMSPNNRHSQSSVLYPLSHISQWFIGWRLFPSLYLSGCAFWYTFKPHYKIQFISIQYFIFSYYKAQIVQYQCKYIATIWEVEITKI